MIELNFKEKIEKLFAKRCFIMTEGSQTNNPILAYIVIDEKNILHQHFTTKTLLKVFHQSITASTEYTNYLDPVHSIDLIFGISKDKKIKKN